jgi:hypothetical protein
MAIDERDREFSELRREVRRLRTVVGILGLGFIGTVGAAFRSRDAEVLRARGLILVDEAGRDRILLGAPIPHRFGSRCARVVARLPESRTVYGLVSRVSAHHARNARPRRARI